MKPTQSPGSSVWGHGKMSSILPERLLYNTLQQRKSNGEILYYEIFKWKMKHAPGTIHRFCDSSLSDQERQSLTSWMRNLDDRSSCQRLQILFSFSVPCLHALEHILNLSTPIISAGAVSITKKGYYQSLFFNACTLYLLSFSLLAKSLQLSLEISATYRLVSYLPAVKWLIFRLHMQCMI